MGNNLHIFNQDKTKAAYAGAKVHASDVTVVKSAKVKSYLTTRSTKDLHSSRCAAYKYLIP